MLRALLGRIAGGIVLVVVLSFLSFAVWAVIPRSANVALALPRGWTDAQKAAEIQRLGLDQPLYEQWGEYAWGLGTRADFGETLSLYGGYPVRQLLVDALPVTLSLAVGGFLLALALALPLGLASALRRRSLLDRGIFLFTVVGIVLHPFLIGLILSEVATERLGLAPERGYCPIRGETEFVLSDRRTVVTCGGLRDWASHLVLPWLTFAIFFLPIYTRMIRARLVETLGEQYVVTAFAKGASERRVITRHVLRNALGPLSAMVAVDAGTIIVAAIYVETIFGLGGIGTLVVQNLSGEYGYDRNVVVGIVVFAAIAISIANLLADAAIRTLDPRVRGTSRAF